MDITGKLSWYLGSSSYGRSVGQTIKYKEEFHIFKDFKSVGNRWINQLMVLR